MKMLADGSIFMLTYSNVFTLFFHPVFEIVSEQ